MVVMSARAWRARPLLPNTKAGRRRRERWRRPCHSLARNVRGGSSRYMALSRAYRGRAQCTWSRCLPPRESTTIGTTGALTLPMLGALTAHGQAAPRSIRWAHPNRTNWVRELPGLVLYTTRCRSSEHEALVLRPRICLGGFRAAGRMVAERPHALGGESSVSGGHWAAAARGG